MMRLEARIHIVRRTVPVHEELSFDFFEVNVLVVAADMTEPSCVHIQSVNLKADGYDQDDLWELKLSFIIISNLVWCHEYQGEDLEY